MPAPPAAVLGIAHVGYIPDARIVGLSKLARVVALFVCDLQVQERLTQQIADWLQEHLAPKGVGVLLEAEHQCMSIRGVAATGSSTVTSAVHGLLRDDAGRAGIPSPSRARIAEGRPRCRRSRRT